MEEKDSLASELLHYLPNQSLTILGKIVIL